MNGDLSYTETGFVKGYWERYEMKPRPRGKEAREGWDQCNRELLKLGPGRHYGEWWGSGIARGYGLKEKRFSLFNAGRWVSRADADGRTVPGAQRRSKRGKKKIFKSR